jgi:hypothetical protein
VANVELNGQRFPLLVDTGSSAHVLSPQILKKLGFALKAPVKGSTPYGPAKLAELGDLQVKIGGLKIPLSDCLAETESSPGGLESDGIYGLLSPPKLAVGALVVLDLREPALIVVRPAPKNIPLWLKQKFPQSSFDEVPRLNEKAGYQEIILVKSEIFGDLQMFLDTGATTTNIYSERPFDSSKPLKLEIQNHQCVTSGARIRPLSSPQTQHLLGMDCLQGKILAFGPAGSASVWIGWPEK